MAELGQISPVLGKYTYMDLSFVHSQDEKKVDCESSQNTTVERFILQTTKSARHWDLTLTPPLPSSRHSVPCSQQITLKHVSYSSRIARFGVERLQERVNSSKTPWIRYVSHKENLILSDTLQDPPVLLSSLFSIPYDIGLPSDKDSADPLKVDTIAKRLMSNHGKVLS